MLWVERPSTMRCVRIRKISPFRAQKSPDSNGIEGPAQGGKKAEVKKPKKTDEEVLKTPENPVRATKTPTSEEIGFINRREHRRQHREDRAL